MVAPGVGFELEIFVENPEDWMLGLLLCGFDQIHEGFSGLGGFVSRGLGRVEIEWKEILTRCRAAALLAGHGPEPEPLADRLPSWRRAVAELASEGEESDDVPA